MTGQHGFTLIELMVSVTILVIIGGTVYTAFNSSLNVYQRESGRVVMQQRCRVGLDQIANDLTNMFYLSGDDDFQFQAEDVSGDTGDQDTITFVTTVDPSPDPFLSQLYPQDETSGQTTEEEPQATSDLVRVVYMLDVDPETDAEVLSDTAEQPLSLLRIVTRTFNLDELTAELQGGVASLVEAEQSAMDAGEEPMTRTQVVIDHVLSLDFKFYDGEEWVETWEEETPPLGVQVLLTVNDETEPTQQVTQSTMSYLRMVAAAQGGGVPGQGGPGPGGQPGGPGGGAPR